MKKVLFVSIVLLLATFIMAQTTIVFWHHESPAHRVAAFQKAVELFQQEYPDIKVVQQVVPWGDAWTKTLAAIDAGTTPDFQFSLPELTITAYQADAIIPLDNIINEIDEKYDFVDSQLEPYMIDGNYWGIPIWTMPMVLIYRPSILEEYLGTSEPPKNWNELLLAAQEITLKSAAEGERIYGIGLTAGNNLCTQEQVYTVMANVGVELFDEDGNLTFNSPETLRAVEFYKDLFKFSPPGATGWAWGEIEMNFSAGKIAMMPYFGGLQKRFYDMGNYDLDGAPQPFPVDGQRGSLTYPNDIHIFKSAREKGHLDEVYKFIRFIMRPEINAVFTAQTEPGSFVPITVEAQESDAYWNDPVISQFEHLNRVIVDEINYGKLYGFETGSAVNLAIGGISGGNLLAEMIQNVVTGRYTVEEAVAETTEKMKDFIEE
jgi:multiple sugar transport system substrate-binding protein